jgi:hypothetical protein
MLYFSASGVNCLPHTRQRNLCLPVLILPYLLTAAEPQNGQQLFGVAAVIDILINRNVKILSELFDLLVKLFPI